VHKNPIDRSVALGRRMSQEAASRTAEESGWVGFCRIWGFRPGCGDLEADRAGVPAGGRSDCAGNKPVIRFAKGAQAGGDAPAPGAVDPTGRDRGGRGRGSSGVQRASTRTSYQADEACGDSPRCRYVKALTVSCRRRYLSTTPRTSARPLPNVRFCRDVGDRAVGGERPAHCGDHDDHAGGVDLLTESNLRLFFTWCTERNLPH
jgi:hypothetical protein